jgi:hypothetical protein
MAARDSKPDLFRQFFVQKLSFRHADQIICPACLTACSGWDNEGGKIDISISRQPIMKRQEFIDRFNFLHKRSL